MATQRLFCEVTHKMVRDEAICFVLAWLVCACACLSVCLFLSRIPLLQHNLQVVVTEAILCSLLIVFARCKHICSQMSVVSDVSAASWQRDMIQPIKITDKRWDMKLTIEPKVISIPICLKTEWSIDHVIPGHRIKAPTFILIPLERSILLWGPCIVRSNRLFNNTEEA